MTGPCSPRRWAGRRSFHPRPRSHRWLPRNLAQRDGGPSADRDLFQLAVGEEGDPLSIGAKNGWTASSVPESAVALSSSRPRT